MKKQFLSISGIFLFSLFILSSCQKESSLKEIISLSFESSKNPSLTADVHAVIQEDSIIAIVPPHTVTGGLIATFEFKGISVSVNSRIQKSGESANDYTSVVRFDVKAEDKSIRSYFVKVKVLANNDNSFSKFEFKKAYNTNLDKNIVCIIRNDSIIADLPLNTDISDLIATFSTGVASVTINNVNQTSNATRNNFTSTLFYDLYAYDGSKRTYTCVVRAEHSFLKFEIRKSLNSGLTEDIQFNINHETGTIKASYLKWIDTPKPSKLIVSFEAQDVEVSVGSTVQESGTTVVDFTNPVKYTTIYIKDDYQAREYVVELICPQINATLPVLRIDAEGPITSEETYVKAKLEISGNGITEGLWDFEKEKIEMRLRGNSTMGLPKKPYRIKFPEKYSPLGLNHAKEKSWVLLANDCDKSLIRNAVAFQMSRILSADATNPRFTACTQFVDVYLDGEYQGNYHLTDQVETAAGRVEVESLKASDGGNQSKISGGYLLELDGFASSEPLYFATPKQLLVTIKYPKDDDYAPEQAAWITSYFAATEDALFSADFKNPTTGWRKYIDRFSWIDYYIISELTGNSDAWWSTYMSKQRDVDYFVVGPVWDFDIAFNNDNRISNAATRLMADAAHDPKIWINRFMQDETFKAAVKARWNAKKGELSGLKAYMDELVMQLDMSQKANFRRWDITKQALGHAMPAQASYGAAVNQLKNYFQARYNYLDAEFNKW